MRMSEFQAKEDSEVNQGKATRRLEQQVLA